METHFPNLQTGDKRSCSVGQEVKGENVCACVHRRLCELPTACPGPWLQAGCLERASTVCLTFTVELPSKGS